MISAHRAFFIVSPSIVRRLVYIVVGLCMVVLSYFARYLRWFLRIARFVGMIGLCCRDVVVSSSRCMFVFVFLYLLLFRITRSVVCVLFFNFVVCCVVVVVACFLGREAEVTTPCSHFGVLAFEAP